MYRSILQNNEKGDWPLVTDNQLSLRNNWLKVKTLEELLVIFRGIYRIYLKFMKKNQKMSTCNQLNLENTRILTNYSQKCPPDKCVTVTLSMQLIKAHCKVEQRRQGTRKKCTLCPSISQATWGGSHDYNETSHCIDGEKQPQSNKITRVGWREGWIMLLYGVEV